MSPRAYAAACALAEDPSASPHERKLARQRCDEYEAKNGKPASRLRPWWTLKVSPKGSGFWLDNCVEFRRALRILRDGGRQHRYWFERSTVKDVQGHRVDWSRFPESEPWLVPNDIRKTVPSQRPILPTEDIVEWIISAVQKPKRQPRPVRADRPRAKCIGVGRARPRNISKDQLPACRVVRKGAGT